MDGIITTRRVGIAAAIVSAVLYLLIGVGFLAIGESTQGPASDLFVFGALMATIYAITALALSRLQSRMVLALIAAFQVIPLLGYVAVAGVREPPYEVWGLLIKACQGVVLVAAAALAWRGRGHVEAAGQPSAKGQPA
jgi:hypothetical protein